MSTSECNLDTGEFLANLEKQIDSVLQSTASERIGISDLYIALDNQIKRTKAHLQKE